jgi:hypothetical protein
MVQLNRRRVCLPIALLCFTAVLGCEELLDPPLDKSKSQRVSPPVAGGPSAPESQEPLEDVSGPPSSGLAFTIWDARLVHLRNLTVKYRYEGALGDARQRYRIVMTVGGNNYHYNIASVEPTTQSTVTLRSPFGAIHSSLKEFSDAQIFVEQVTGTPENPTVTRVSNTITVKDPNQPVVGNPGNSSSASTGAEASASQKGPRIGFNVDRAWFKMSKDVDENKIVVIKLTGIDELEIGTRFLEMAEKLCAASPGMKSSVVTDNDYAAAILGPCEDLRGLADRIDFGKVTAVDTSRRVIEVSANADIFSKNRKGIAVDSTHADYFRVNLELINTTKGPAFADRARHAIIRRLKGDNPNQCTDKATRSGIARAYKEAVGESDLPSEVRIDAVEGLVNWSGKYSVPILIDLLERGKDYFIHDRDLAATIVTALGTARDPKAVEPLTRLLADTKFGIKMVEKPTVAVALTKIGAPAEQAMMDLAPHNDPEVSILSIQILGEIGTQKSVPLLRKARQSRNPLVRDAAKQAMDKINDRRGSEQEKS